MNRDGVHVGGGGHWGHCSPQCPGVAEANERPLPVAGVSQPDQRVSPTSCKLTDGRSGTCREPALCVGLTQKEENDNICDDGSNSGLLLVCCPELVANNIKVKLHKNDF